MDMTTMMSSMPQVQTTGASSAGAQTSGAVASATVTQNGGSAFALLFAELAGSSIPAAGTANPMSELLQALTGMENPDQPKDGTESSEKQPNSANNDAALSIMQLLGGLRNLMTESRKAEGDQSGKGELAGTEPGKLLKELEELLNREGSESFAFEEASKQITASLSSMNPDETKSGKGDEVGMAAELAALLNGMIRQDEVKPADIKVPADNTGNRIFTDKNLPIPQIAAGQLTQSISALQQPLADQVVNTAAVSVQQIPSAQTNPSGGLDIKSVLSLLDKKGLQGPAGAVQKEEKPVEITSNDSVIKVEETLLSEIEMVLGGDNSQQSESFLNEQRQSPIQSGAVHIRMNEVQTQPATIDKAVVPDSNTTVSHDQIMSQVREKLAEQRVSTDGNQVVLRLHPAELGELKISMRMDDQRVRIEIVAENRTVKDALMNNLDNLKEALSRQNVAMESFDVSTNSRNFFNHGFKEGYQEQQNLSGRQTAWLTGRMGESEQEGQIIPAWQPRENALLDMML